MEWIIGASPEVADISRWRKIVAKVLSLTILMILIVGLRFWVRRKSLHREDWVTLVTAVFSITYCASCIIQTRYGLGLPLDLRPKEDQKEYAILSYTSRPFYLWGIGGFKLALCLMYLHMTRRTLDKRFRWFIIAVAVFSTTAQIIFSFLAFFSCIPLAKMFDPSIHGKCLKYAPLAYTVSATTILCDVVIFLTPIPLIYRLKLEKTVKLGLTIVFGLGLLTTICSILRMQQIHRVAYGDGDSTLFVVRSCMELNVGIITSCLPVLRPFLSYIPRRLVARLPFSSTSTTEQDPHHPTRRQSIAHSITHSIALGNCFKVEAPDSEPAKPPPTSRLTHLKTSVLKRKNLRNSQSKEQILPPLPSQLRRPEQALVRSKSCGSERRKEWRDSGHSGVLKTVEVDVESSYVLSPGRRERVERTGEEQGGGGDKGLVTRWGWE